MTQFPPVHKFLVIVTQILKYTEDPNAYYALLNIILTSETVALS